MSIEGSAHSPIVDKIKKSVSARTKRGGSLILKMLAAYESYLCYHRMFDTANLQSALKGSGIRAPRFGEYYRAIMQYFIQSLAVPELKRAA